MDRLVDMGEQGAKTTQATWLLVHSADRAGLLAEIAQIITAHSHNIKVLPYKSLPIAGFKGINQLQGSRASTNRSHVLIQAVSKCTEH